MDQCYLKGIVYFLEVRFSSSCRIKKLGHIRSRFNITHSILLLCTQVNVEKRALCRIVEGVGEKGRNGIQNLCGLQNFSISKRDAVLIHVKARSQADPTGISLKKESYLK